MDFRTKNIDLSSTITTVTGVDPSPSFDESGLATFIHSLTPTVTAVVMGFDAGLQVEAKALLNTRNRLFKLIRAGGRSL
jgi:hypothetical protein